MTVDANTCDMYKKLFSQGLERVSSKFRKENKSKAGCFDKN